MRQVSREFNGAALRKQTMSAYSFYLFEFQLEGHKHRCESNTCIWKAGLWPNGLPRSRTPPRGPGGCVRSPPLAPRGPDHADTAVQAPLRSHIPALRQRCGARSQVSVLCAPSYVSHRFLAPETLLPQKWFR